MDYTTNFTLADNNICMPKGNTLSFALTFEGLDQELESAEFYCKNALDSDEYLFRKTLGDGISKTESGYIVRVAPEDTADLNLGSYYHELRIGVNSDVFTLLKGVLTLT